MLLMGGRVPKVLSNCRFQLLKNLKKKFAPNLELLLARRRGTANLATNFIFHSNPLQDLTPSTTRSFPTIRQLRLSHPIRVLHGTLPHLSTPPPSTLYRIAPQPRHSSATAFFFSCAPKSLLTRISRRNFHRSLLWPPF